MGISDKRAAIHVEDLTAGYDSRPVLWDIDLDIEERSITGIIGPNGAGKSTLLKSILGFIKPVSGSVAIFGMPFKEARSEIAYVPQFSSVNWNFPVSVEDVVLMGRYRYTGWFKRADSIQRKAAGHAMEEMGIEGLAKRQISELSGGQKQRVFIARAIAQDTRLLIMDEPLAGVDKLSEKIIMDKLDELRTAGRTIVCVHHDLNTLRKYFDNLVMIQKYIVASGRLEEVLNDENLRLTYEGGISA